MNSQKIERISFFIVYIAIFFVLPVFFVVPYFKFPEKQTQMLFFLLLVLSIIYIPHEWKKFPEKNYRSIFFLWIFNGGVVLLFSGVRAWISVLLVSWAITLSSILCTDVLLSLKKQIQIVKIQKRESETRNTPFLKQYWKKEYRKSLLMKVFDEQMFFLFSSLIITIVLYLAIIFPLYVLQYSYPMNILLGAHVCVSFIWGVFHSVKG